MINEEKKEEEYTSSGVKKIGVLGVVMVTVVCIDSLRNVPLIAKLGWWSIPLFTLGALGFMMPTAIASAELTSRFPQLGGISVWVRYAFGKKPSFVIVWIQWIYNVLWFPTIAAFAATHLCYAFAHSFGFGEYFGINLLDAVSDKGLVAILSVTLFWIGTAINCLGVRRVSAFSGFTTISGTFLPMILIIILAGIWLLSGNVSHLAESNSVIDTAGGSILGIFSVVLFALLGLEISSAHAGQVKNPTKNYPRALWLLVLVVPLSLILTAVSMGIVIPPKELAERSGLIDSFIVIFKVFNMPSALIPIMSLLIFIGAFGTMAAWSFGISRYLKKTAEMGFVPKWLGVSNKNGVPANAMIFQGCCVTALSGLYFLFPNVSAAYWFLGEMTVVLAIGAYVIFFIATMKLRNEYEWKKGVHYIWGPKIASFSMYIIGIVVSIIGVAAAFYLPSQDTKMSIYWFNFWLAIGTVLAILFPLAIIQIRKFMGYDIEKDVTEIMDDESKEEQSRMY